MCRAWQVVVKVCGVATTRPQGQSRAPRPSTEQQCTWEPSTHRSLADRRVAGRRVSMGRSRRSTSRSGEPTTWGRATAKGAASDCQSGDAPANTGAAAWPSFGQAFVAVRKIQNKLHCWAGTDGVRRFDDLYNLVCDPNVLAMAWERVTGNK